MIVYLANKTRFREDILSIRIEESVNESGKKELGKSVGAIELASWKHSPRHMAEGLPGPIDLRVQALSGALLDTGVKLCQSA